MALGLGLKVDAEAVPPAVAAAIRAGSVDLNDPANTLVLLEADGRHRHQGVPGRKPRDVGWHSHARSATRLSTTRSLRESGRRLDGWPNRDLNVRRDRRARSAI